MATRGGGSTALIITTVVFGILTVTGFVVSIIQFSNATEVRRSYERLQSDYEQIIRPTELSAERVEAAINRAGNVSAVDFLLTQNASLKRTIAGNPEITMDRLEASIDERTGGASGSLLAQVASGLSEIDRLEEEIERTRARAETAIADAEAEAARVSSIRAGFEQTVSSERQRIGSVEQRVDSYDTRLTSAVEGFSSERSAMRTRFENEIADREDRIAELNQQVLVLRDQLARLRGEATGGTISPPDEFALIDGEVIDINTVNGEVIIDLGRGDKLQIGQIFSVYARAGDIRPDPNTGEYEPGKAAIEVIRVNEDGSRARVIRSSAGNPVVRGDVIASPVYDPDKTYRFVVDGIFDYDGDGSASRLERSNVENLIRRWGGVIQDDIAGDTDFLVLGARPELPPPPTPGVPREVVIEYNRIRRSIERYDELFQRSERTSLPILNENRLRTLIGDFPD